MEHFVKRKREMLGKDTAEEEGSIFKRSNKIVRSLEGRDAGNDLRIWLEGLKGVREEIREMAERQKEAIRSEVEKQRGDEGQGREVEGRGGTA